MDKPSQLPMLPPECPVLGKHNPVKIDTKTKPDKTYWCTGCGATGLKATEK